LLDLVAYSQLKAKKRGETSGEERRRKEKGERRKEKEKEEGSMWLCDMFI